MAVRIESMAEPLPGYRLIERLGGGGFGEVWKAEAPGGLFKAIKFVYGDLEAADDEGARAGQEFKALKRVISVRHPFILSVERFDVIDGQLMIVTELADRTLWDRFRECRGKELAGIPREELLKYLGDTAEALDLMNSNYQLQHLDIKPQNLFLVHDHVKVADFGLVKDLEGMLASVTGGVTPVYAAPETFEGKVSRFSDQYSLAIVYQELLTGQRPYSGNTLRQLVLQHCQGVPDLKSLPDHDRPIVLRALAKKHEDRYPSCTTFIDALRTAGQARNGAAVAVPGPLVAPGPVAATPATRADMHADDGVRTEGPRAIRDLLAPAVPAPERAAPPGSTPGRSWETPPNGLHAVQTPPPAPAIRRPSAEVHPEGVLAPAVVIGVGQFGLGTLRQLRKEVTENFGSPDAVPALHLLYIDTDPETCHRAARGTDEVALRAGEVFLTKLHRPSHYIKPRETETGLQTWLNPTMLYRIPRQQTTAGIRALGRLAFVDHYKTLARRLRSELEECSSKEALERSCAETGLTIRAVVPRVFVVANLGGGTGGGMLLDLAYLARQQLHALGHDSAEVIGVCYLPPADRDPRRAAELANAFAALSELNHFSSPHAVFTACYELGEKRKADPLFTWRGPPMNRCQFFALPEKREAAVNEDAGGAPVFPPLLSKTLSTVARCLFSECTTGLGRAADEQRLRPTAETGAGRTRADRPAASQGGAQYQLVGLYRILWPRRQLLEQAASGVCRRLVKRWMSKDARPIRDAVQEWMKEKWEAVGLSADQAIGRFQESCQNALGRTPESSIQAIHAEVSRALAAPPGKPQEAPVNLAAVAQALEQFEQLVGVPEECRPHRQGEPSHQQPGSVEEALKEVSGHVVDYYEQKLAELAVKLIEDPAFRLAGAEEGLRQLHTAVEQTLKSQEQLAAELQQRAAGVYQRLHRLTDGAAQIAARNTPARRGPATPVFNAPEILELLRLYPKYRYHSLLMHRVTSLYVSLRGLLSDQIREVDFCRARIGELHALFEGGEIKSLADGPAAGRYLFSEGCKSLDEAVKKLDGCVTPQHLVELDGRIQGLIRRQFKALVHVCMSSANVLRVLAPAMRKETRAYLQTALGSTTIAQIYLEQFGDESDPPERLQDDLAEAFEKACPEVAASSPVRELNLLGVPPGDGEQELRGLVRSATDGIPLLPVPSSDEIVMYREHTLACLMDLNQLGPLGQEAYQKLCAQENFTPHSRADVAWGPRA
jgi:hypothetical protein